MRLVQIFLGVLLACSFGVESSAEINTGHGPGSTGNDTLPLFDGSCTWEISPQEAARAASIDAPVSNIVYLNRCEGGCDLNAGNGDSKLNRSSLLVSDGRLTQSVLDDELFGEVVDLSLIHI